MMSGGRALHQENEPMHYYLPLFTFLIWIYTNCIMVPRQNKNVQPTAVQTSQNPVSFFAL